MKINLNACNQIYIQYIPKGEVFEDQKGRVCMKIDGDLRAIGLFDGCEITYTGKDKAYVLEAELNVRRKKARGFASSC